MRHVPLFEAWCCFSVGEGSKLRSTLLPEHWPSQPFQTHVPKIDFQDWLRRLVSAARTSFRCVATSTPTLRPCEDSCLATLGLPVRSLQQCAKRTAHAAYWAARPALHARHPMPPPVLRGTRCRLLLPPA